MQLLIESFWIFALKKGGVVNNLIIIIVTMLLCFLSIYFLFQWPLALGSLAAWVTTGSFFLQVVHILKNKDTSGLSIGMWAALFLA